MAKKNTGTIIVKANGESLRAQAESVTFKPGGMKRESKFADGRYAGYTETPVSGEVSLDFIHDGDTDIDTFRNMTNATLVLEMDSGQVWQIDNAFVDAESLEVSKDGGKCTIMGEFAERTK